MIRTACHILILTIALLTGGCHNATPPGYGGSGPELGIAGEGDAESAAWLADPDPRYEGPDLTLRYSDGGVMITRDAAGSEAFIDLDSGDAAEYDPAAGHLTVRGRDHSVTAETVAADGNAVWLRLTDADGSVHLIVTEP